MAIDLYDALGLTRTEELLSAVRYMGVDQYFTRVIDYGFSKTREEALEKWGHDRILADAVRVVRTVRPLVVTSVFVAHHRRPWTSSAGGRDRAGGLARGGRSVDFRNRLRDGLRPWSPLKVYARVPNFNVTKDGMYDYAIDSYSDRLKAQAVVNVLIAFFRERDVEARASASQTSSILLRSIYERKAGENLEVLNPPSLPDSDRPNRLMVAAAGLSAGLLVGAITLCFRRPASDPGAGHR